ncbi:hypothetical protein NHX12_007412 [Muraenolepis orangiensis]|uniref:Uncharacterized protein n=1 Tax=Muraenolepis orangiensis TaxID=630683 RepID=A0A9Q0IB61_9TELE|nr:hypothetical protein NHX12_007412 [Muraenolepis orangiensis]
MSLSSPFIHQFIGSTCPLPKIDTDTVNGISERHLGNRGHGARVTEPGPVCTRCRAQTAPAGGPDGASLNPGLTAPPHGARRIGRCTLAVERDAAEDEEPPW